MTERRMMAVSRDVRHGERLHRMLVAELSGAGCFRPAAARTAAYGAFILASYAAAYAALLTGPGVAARALAIFVLAFISVQAGFLSHEAGHGAITRDRRVADLLGQVFHTLLTALCYSYFRHIHRLHHTHCNDRGRDPDMQSEFVSMYLQSALTKTGLGRLISRHQGVLIWILIGLQGFTLKIDSLQFLRRNPRSTRVDQCVVLLHYALWLLPQARHRLSRDVVVRRGARGHASLQRDVSVCPMNLTLPAKRGLVLAASLLALGGCAVRQLAVNSLGDAIAQGGAAFAADDDPELIRAAAPFSLKLIESLLAESPEHKGLLLAASRGFTQYAYAFLQQEAE